MFPRKAVAVVVVFLHLQFFQRWFIQLDLVALLESNRRRPTLFRNHLTNKTVKASLKADRHADTKARIILRLLITIRYVSRPLISLLR